MTKFKYQNKFKVQIPRHKLCHLCFVIWIYFVICALLFGFIRNSYALDLNKAKIYFLKGDYESCIEECKKIVPNQDYAQDLDELYYFLGLSYLKLNQFKEARGALEKIINNSHNSDIKLKASVSIGDTYFLEGKFSEAELVYKQQLIKPQAALYLRLMFIYLKQGNWQGAEEELSKLKRGFPLSPELEYAKNIGQLATYFTVQVGSFSQRANANEFCEQLKSQGFAAYIQEDVVKGSRFFRVRVGRLNNYPEAKGLAEELSQMGYPVKIFP